MNLSKHHLHFQMALVLLLQLYRAPYKRSCVYLSTWRKSPAPSSPHSTLALKDADTIMISPPLSTMNSKSFAVPSTKSMSRRPSSISALVTPHCNKIC